MLALSIGSFKLARVDLLDETNSKARSIFAYFSVRSSCSCRLILTKCYHEWILNLNKFLGIRNLNPVFFFCFFFCFGFCFFLKKNRWPESCYFFSKKLGFCIVPKYCQFFAAGRGLSLQPNFEKGVAWQDLNF